MDAAKSHRRNSSNSSSTSTIRNQKRLRSSESTPNAATTNTASIDIINERDISSSKWFYERYIALRKPCVISMNPTTHQDGKTSSSTTGSTAQRIVEELLLHPETMVQVERRLSTQERFGQSRYTTQQQQQQQRQVIMSISSFVKDICHILPESNSHRSSTHTPDQTDNIQNDGKTNETDLSTSMLYYLSTQEPSDTASNTNNDDVDDDNDTSQPKRHLEPLPQPYYGPPCDILHQTNLLPTLPPLTLAGYLRLHSINLWMGYTPALPVITHNTSSTSTASSPSHHSNHRPQHSGLHFDYHDNFYSLLHGEKTFYLYPPNCAPYLLLQGGTIDAIHTNGLISFTRAPIAADGRSQPERIQNHQTLHTAIPTPHDENHNDDDTEEEDYDEEEEEEVVLGKGYDYESSDDDDNEDGTDWHVHDDNDHKDDHNGDDDFIDDVDDDELLNQQRNGTDNNNRNLDTNRQGDKALSREEMWLPSNFSWIDPIHTTREQIIQTFPIYAQCPMEYPYKVTLLPNQCLYLPASWLHCVISSGHNDTTDHDNDLTTTTNNNGIHIPSAVHMAINYWYHPPDNLNDYDHPYVDRQFWERPSFATTEHKKT